MIRAQYKHGRGKKFWGSTTSHSGRFKVTAACLFPKTPIHQSEDEEEEEEEVVMHTQSHI